MKKTRMILISSFLVIIVIIGISKFLNININYIDSESSTQRAEADESGISPQSLFGVEVNDYNTFKYYLELNDGNEYHLHLKTSIFVDDTVKVNGVKAIIGYGYFIVNNRSVDDSVNTSIAINSGATLTIDNCVFDGRNKNSVASSNVVVSNGGTCIVNNNARFHNGTQGIHVSTTGKLTVNNGAFLENTSFGIGAYGTVIFNDGITGQCVQGLHNNGGNLTVNGGDISGSESAVANFTNGTARVTNGNLHGATRGVYNEGTATITGGNIYSNTEGVVNASGHTCTISGGKIYNNTNGIKNYGTSSISGTANIYSNSIGINNSGTLTVSNGTIKDNTATNGSAIYHNGTSCTITGGTFGTNQNVYLASNDKFVATNTSYPVFVVKPNTYTRGRTLVKTSGNTYATNELSNITLVPSGKWQKRVNVSNIVIWDKSNIIVTYKDEKGNELASSETFTNWVGESYSTSSKTLSGYDLKTIPTNATGTYGENDITVSYVYTESTGSVETKYIDQVTKKEISTKIVTDGIIGEDYTTQAKDIEGYELVLTPDNSTGKYSQGTVVVTYEYRKLSNIVTKFIDLNYNRELKDSVSVTLKEGENYTTSPVEINGYKLVLTPQNNNGIVGNTDIEVIYGYKKISLGVIVKHIDDETGNNIADEEKINGLEKDIYNTAPKEIEGYELISVPENSSGEMTEEEIEVIYIYSLIKGKITITKVDKNDNTKFLSGATFKVEKLDDEGNVDTTFNVLEKTTLENGKVEFIDLNIGKYRVTETKAPDGYELSKNVSEVEITKEQKQVNITATDKLKLELPKTGGKGTSLFTISGIILILISIIIAKYINKKENINLE